jgi:DNA end-binding protein Ku
VASTVWRGRLAFGLVSIPVRLHRASRRERMRFHHVYRRTEREEAAPEEVEPEPEPQPSQRVAQVAPTVLPRAIRQPAPEPAVEVEPESATVERVRSVPPVAPQQILKGFEYEKGRYVTLGQEEWKALRPKTSDELEIAQFVRLDEIDPLYFDASFYASPDRGGEKPYAMLCEAMRASGYAALGSFAMHGREHMAVIRPAARGIVVHTLFYAHEVHAADEYTVPSGQTTAKEVELAQTLIRALAAPFEPERFKDAFEEKVRALVKARAAAGLAPEAGAEASAGRPSAPVIDIMEALKKSLESARKPAARETAALATSPARKRAR